MASVDVNDFSTDMTEREVIRSDRKLRIGIIGMGGISGFHIVSYKKQPDVEIVAGADLVPGRAAQVLGHHEVNAKAFTDYKEMIDTMDLDAVSVCTYNRTHAECAIYALEHDIPVLLEKPMAVTLDEAVEICRAEKKSKAFVSVGFQPRMGPNEQMVKKIVQSGELGDVYYIQTGGGRRRGIPVSWTDSFIRDETAGLGALGDIGCYSLDLVLNAIGNPKPLTVTGTRAGIFGNNPESYAQFDREKAEQCAKIFSVDDFASAYIRLEGGIVLDFRIAWHMHLNTPGDTIIMGTKGSLRIPSTECWNGGFGGPMTIYHNVAGSPVETKIPPIECKFADLFDKKIRSFLNAIITGGKAPVPTNEILYNQAILDAIARSSDLGREVIVEIPEI